VKRGTPKLSDFRDDNFLAFLPEIADDYQYMVRTVCQLDGGFEPKLLPIGNTSDSLIRAVPQLFGPSFDHHLGHRLNAY
jgi:hypothetical protein